VTEPVALLALVAAAAALRIVSGGALPPSLVPAGIVPGNAIQAGMPGERIARSP